MHINHVLMAFLIITRLTIVPITVAEREVGAVEVVGALIGAGLAITLKEIQGEQRLEITSKI